MDTTPPVGAPAPVPLIRVSRDDLTLAHGQHATRAQGMCAMEAVAWLAGEAHSDHPLCACPVLASFVRMINDLMGADRQALKAILPDLIGSRSTTEVERRRAIFFADRAVREFAPIALDHAGVAEHAAALRALPEICDAETAKAARRATRVADNTPPDAIAVAGAAAAAAAAAAAELSDDAMAADAAAAAAAAIPVRRIVEVIREALAIQEAALGENA